MSIVISYADGSVSECENLDAAKGRIESDHPDCIYAEQWDADGVNDDGKTMERLLVWATEEDAENDPGANAVAQFERIA